MATILSTRETRIARDKTNILNEKQCKTFIKDYRDYINGKISQFKHPKTRAQIKEAAKVKYLYNKCAEKYEIGSSMKSVSVSKLKKMMSKKTKTLQQSKSLSKSSSKSSDLLKYEKYISIKGDDDIRDILYLPNITTFKSHRNLIRRLFSVPISVKKGIIVLKEHLNDPNNHEDYAISYREYVWEISKLIAIYDPFINKSVYTKYIENYFDINKNNNVHIFIEYCIKVYISAIFEDTRNLNMGNFTYEDNYRRVTTTNGFYARLSQCKYEYYALYYVNETMSYLAYTMPELMRQLIIIKNLITNLLDKNFAIEDPNVSISLSQSSSNSNSDNTTNDSSMNTIYRKLGKKEYVKYIMNNGNNPQTVNDEELYSGYKWNELSINKLRMVVKISTKINNKVFTYAFYARSLYKDWRNAIKNKKPFINRLTNTPFTEDDEREILRILERKYPLIEKPRLEYGRNDIHYQEPEIVRINGIYFWCINIWFNSGTRENTNFIKIVSVHFIEYLQIYHEDGINIEYNPAFLFENINKLKKENKIISKKMPFKLHPAFVKYYNSYITTEEQYKDFFTLISRSV